ncbi:Rne/Rng family ribonuclease [Nocardioides sp. Kera G14]|uniref:Rne/Rng family ribonuclease n=1 Tax=Nocardioides sp. Kera G14 TaxID=2884264 RepID=UPI001D11835D|nr:Rne/Rng family ribonuclease [Nocardioides sp. Kera G14]UDY24507.1 Rne/Rng family ribonuclease [Nocardioides sp. Kera G14]
MADDLTVDSTTTESGPAVEAGESAAPVKKAAKKAPAKRAPRKTAAKKVPDALADGPAPDLTADAADPVAETVVDPATALSEAAVEAPEKPARKTAAKKTAAKKTAAKKTAVKKTTAKKAPDALADGPAPDLTDGAVTDPAAETVVEAAASEPEASTGPAAPAALFQAPEKAAPRKRTRKAAAPKPEPVVERESEADEEDAEAQVLSDGVLVTDEVEATEIPEAAGGADDEDVDDTESDTESDADGEDEDGSTPARRRRRRGGRRRRKPASANAGEEDDSEDSAEQGHDTDSAEAGETDTDEDNDDSEGNGEGGSSRRRRRRRRAGDSGGGSDDEPGVNTVVKVRESRPLEQQITSISGSTRLEAKKQRRRDGREAGRRRAPIVSEAEFLARRESVDRVMVIRQRGDLTQIGVLEDKVLVEHYVARESQTSMIGNIYLGRVQNVLPSMEAAFIDIGKGRNAVLYAGEVNWSALGHKEGQPRKIESVLSSGQTVLVQVTKDPVGHKGARLTSQISLAGRFLVYVPDGTTSGISRKLPDTERNRLKSVLKEIVPDTAGVIVRTAAEGASEEELTRDVERLKARWEDIEGKAAKGGNAQLLYGEPDLTLKVVRDLFTEDFAKLVIQGDDAWETVKNYVDHVAPDLAERLEKHETTRTATDAMGKEYQEQAPDLFAVYRVDEQIAKGLDRKVWLPSGGSLVIDRTEAMTVVDVNTGKFTGSGGNLEETVTKNNLEAAEEIVRQLRLRDIGGIIVVDFIDMVLESNRDLVLRRLVECLGRDRTRHQVAEVTSLGLVQMTRKRIGTGLVEAFSETCSHCQGRGIVVHDHPVATSGAPQVEPDEQPRGRRRRGGKGRNGGGDEAPTPEPTPAIPSPKVIASLPRHEYDDEVVHADDALAESDAEAAPLDGDTVLESNEELETTADLTDEVVVEIEPESTPDAAPDELVVDVPAEPQAPKVITRTRGRRGASTAVISTGEAAVVEVSADDVPAAPPVEATPPPKVVTRTRRGASRA